MNVITKQGSNNWHGTVGSYHTDNKLQARNEFQTKVPVFRRNEGAWSLGGPLWKNHTFVFLSMDILKSGVAFSEAATVLTPDFIGYVNTNFPNNVSNQVFGKPTSCRPMALADRIRVVDLLQPEHWLALTAQVRR